jgi:2'-5' RNA ligase
MNQLNSHQFEGIYKTLDINLDKLGCVMLDIEPLNNMWSIEQDGAGIALYYSKNKDRKWIDGWIVNKVAHITLLYGLLDNAHNWENIIDMALWDWKLDEVEIDHIGYFDSPYEDENYYCLVAHIKVTDELMEGHQRLELLPHINTFTGYKPHMTICYLDKSQGEGYRDTMIKHFNECWAGKKLKVKEGLNLGYKPDPQDTQESNASEEREEK